MQIPAATKRLRFRAFQADDAANVLRVFSDAYAQRFFSSIQDLPAAQRMVERQLERYRTLGHGFWILEHLDDGRYIGGCGLTFQRTDRDPVLEVGYHVLAAERANGYATEAASRCLECAFDVLAAERVASIVHPDNVASRRVADRIHAFRRDFVRDGQPLCLYFTDRSAWETRGVRPASPRRRR